MRVRRLVRTGADAVTDRVARLAGVARFGETCADALVEFGQARAGGAERDRVVVYAGEHLEQLLVLRRQHARAEVLRVVGPVAVGTDPDLEQRRLIRDDRAV